MQTMVVTRTMESPLLDIWSNLVWGLLPWRSKLQPVVTWSTTEAEYIAAGAAGMEICWFQNVLIGMGFTKTYSDASLYIFDQDGIKVIVLMFVDDITLASM